MLRSALRNCTYRCENKYQKISRSAHFGLRCNRRSERLKVTGSGSKLLLAAVHSFRLGCRCSDSCSRANSGFRASTSSLSAALDRPGFRGWYFLGATLNQRRVLDPSELVFHCGHCPYSVWRQQASQQDTSCLHLRFHRNRITGKSAVWSWKTS